MQYFYSGLVLWIKYCHLWPLWFYPVFSFPFLFPLVFTSLGDDSLVHSLCLCWDFFHSREKWQVFFPLLSSLSFWFRVLAVFYTAHLAKSVLVYFYFCLYTWFSPVCARFESLRSVNTTFASVSLAVRVIAAPYHYQNTKWCVCVDAAGVLIDAKSMFLGNWAVTQHRR